MKQDCESKIIESACGRGYQMFTQQGSDGFDTLIAKSDSQSQDLLFVDFIDSLDTFIESMKKVESLADYLEKSFRLFEHSDKKISPKEICYSYLKDNASSS
jgi:hypothetical protein